VASSADTGEPAPTPSWTLVVLTVRLLAFD
jgi:hypothetical protein